MHGSTPGNVTILGRGPAGAQEGLLFGQGGGVQNVTFKDTWYGVQASHGTFDISGCSFDGAGGGGYFAGFINDTIGTLDTTGGVMIRNIRGSLGAIYVDNTAKVSWMGGGTTAITGGGPGINLVFMRGGAELTIDGVNLTNYLGYFVLGYDQAKVTVQSSTIMGSGWAQGVGGRATAGVIYLGGSQTGRPAPSVTLMNTNITGSLGNAVAIATTANTATVSITATNSHLDNSSLAGIWISGNANPNNPVNISATGSSFDHNGIAGITSPRGTITFAGTANSASSNGAMAAGLGQTPGGILLTDPASANSIVMRNATVSSNTGNQITLNGSTSSVLDLGTTASAGGVTFSGVPATFSAVALSAHIAATAIGDTWMPSVQGANASGRYTTPTTITGPASGLNVTEPAGASVVVAP